MRMMLVLVAGCLTCVCGRTTFAERDLVLATSPMLLKLGWLLRTIAVLMLKLYLPARMLI